MKKNAQGQKRLSMLSVLSVICTLTGLVFILLAVAEVNVPIVLGWLIPLGFISGFILGILALILIKNKKDLRGKGYALASIVLGGMFILLVLIVYNTVRMRKAHEEKTLQNEQTSKQIITPDNATK
jgi:FtsH-binding integral membrane protein